MRVLLVEDEPDLGIAIERTLITEKYVVDRVLDGDTAWEYLDSNSTQYTVAIFDWMLPGISGIELCRRVRQAHSSLPILILTAKDSMVDKVTGLDAGADDYLVKPFGMVELLARLRALQRRSPQLQPQQLQIGQLILDYDTRTVFCQQKADRNRVVSLTNKEFQILEYLMQHHDRVVSTEQIRSQVWEVDTDSFSNVVAANMRLLRRKLTGERVTFAMSINTDEGQNNYCEPR
jgi:DNA-binding response OmpR family regulator